MAQPATDGRRQLDVVLNDQQSHLSEPGYGLRIEDAMNEGQLPLAEKWFGSLVGSALKIRGEWGLLRIRAANVA